jgi:hypothetical protein
VDATTVVNAKLFSDNGESVKVTEIYEKVDK